ncbi:MAG: outer membrane lipoprotein carrier protein LolA [Proteobacteria bacterium]|nr:outer membrane lipoprotein carrier protein LolA [Pseudomonadota bacterium]
MQKLFVRAALAFLVLLVGLTGGAAAETQSLLSAVQKKYAGVKTLTADYERTTSTGSLDGVFKTRTTQTASGFLLFKKPAKLILNQGQPRTEKMVTDGRTVWWFIPEEHLVYRYPQVDVYGQLKPLLDFLNGLGSLEGRFEVKITPAGPGEPKLHQLDLKRLEQGQGQGPTGITVWLAPEDLTLVRFRMTSLMGETTDFSLSNVRLDQSLDDDIFVFRIPAGVQVLDQTGAR